MSYEYSEGDFLELDLIDLFLNQLGWDTIGFKLGKLW
jgi:hypothetical protein